VVENQSFPYRLTPIGTEERREPGGGEKGHDMSDNYERVRENASLREYAAAHLKPARGGKRDNYVCPACNSGEGKNKSAAFYVLPDGRRGYCHSCHWEGDIFDLWGLLNGETEKAEQLRGVADWAGIELEGGYTASRSTGGGFKAKATDYSKVKAEGGTTPEDEKEKTEAAPDYTKGREKHRRYIAECARRMADEPTEEILSYLSARGFTHDEAVTLGIGYDPSPQGWKDAAGAWHNTPRLVLPWAGSDYYHVDRAIDDRAKDAKYIKPKADEVGAQPFYNPEAFSQDYVIAVEGVLDAIALQLCGLNAVALGGTAVNDFANEAAARNYSGVVIDMLDADGEPPAEDGTKGTKGRGAGAELVSLLAEAGITTFARAEYGIHDGEDYLGYKDAAEWFADSRSTLEGSMGAVRDFALDKAKAAKDAEYREALRHLNVKDPAKVARDVLELRGVYEPVPTGIQSLDEALGGGVNLGELTIIGAVSSYGKTTLTLQIADFMASRGHSVLFVTIEQSAKELVAKSLSRLVYTEAATGWNVTTPNEITSLKERKAWGEGKNTALSKAVDDYQRMIAPHMRILEGNEQPTVKDIRAVASAMKEHDGQAPIIFIDYVQLLAPLSGRYDSDKRSVDENVSELRKMARDLNTHIWTISSLNRESYTNGVSMTAFKESGSLEFGSDNLIGLQMRGMAEMLDKASGSDAKIKRDMAQQYQRNKVSHDRECELVILKQRNGALPEKPLPLIFKTLSAYFTEPTGGSARAEQAPRHVV